MGQEEVLNLLKELYEKDSEKTYSVKELAEMLGKARSSIEKCLKKLVKQGEIYCEIKYYDGNHLHKRKEYRALSFEEKRQRSKKYYNTVLISS